MIIIPARLASSRLPKKVLVEIDGIPMVIRTALIAKDVDDVVIATDSQEVMQIAKKYSIDAVMTSPHHKSGTDRIKQASDILQLKADDFIINLQADEPFIEGQILLDIKRSLMEIRQRDFVMVSCYKLIDELSAEEANLVKVILDKNSDAIYFSRSKIPYNRDNSVHQYKGHIGIYGFDKRSLDIFCQLTAPIEDIEKLEQLRVIYNGYKIKMIEVKTNSFGIDTIEDLNKAQIYARSRN
ncbi:MAG: 3-deoxy-manno-octulosonate cytidylyltransferase [Epsilonproteobacteria bacterium]|nr:3-deoxy-manno-octulosonate cytidylyltransferase [Campylobacterota bacterium]